MKRNKLLVAVLATGTLALSAQGQATGSKASAGAAHKKTSSKKRVTRHAAARKESATEAQVRELRGMLLTQQAQIDLLKTQVVNKDQQITVVQQGAADAQAQAVAAQATAAQVTAEEAQTVGKIDTLQTTILDLKSVDNSLTDTLIATQKQVSDAQTPASIHYKNLTITPVAFFAFEGVFRNRATNSDINTPFNSIPFPSANEGHASELNFSGRQSRLGALFEGNAGAYKLSGYFESDFLGTGTSSNNNQSNSYVFRQRQIWGKAETTKGFAVIGGQMWSLVTEDGVSTNNRTEKLPNTVDPQYMVGFSWERQPALRFQQRFGDVKKHALTVAMALEQAQITGFTLNNAANAPSAYFFAGVGQNGGLYNAAGNVGAGNTAGTGAITTYANNTAPDVLFKAAIDLPKAHFEFGGIARFMRDFYFPVLSLSAPTTAAPGGVYQYGTQFVANTKAAGGVFGSLRVSPSKFADIAVQGVAGQGTGRYGSSQLADATLRPDGSLEPIRNYHGLFSLETHPAPKLDVYAYYGGEYAQRTVYTNANGLTFGYGARNINDTGCYNLPIAPVTGGSGGSLTPVNCGSPTRYIQEGMLGFTYRIVNSPKYGRLQYQATYSYLQRNLWSGVGSATSPTGARALENMVHFGMRYYIP